MRVISNDHSFQIATPAGEVLIRHSADRPAFSVGRAQADISMYRGNFDLSETLSERIDLVNFNIASNNGQCPIINLADASDHILLTLTLAREGLTFDARDSGLNRFWLRLAGKKDEAIWGAGEQLSYLNLKGRHFPLWAAESGVGRDKSTELTQTMDREGKAGGDYWSTGYPQPTFLSSRRYAVHVNTSAYAEFDFRSEDQHEIYCWEIPKELLIFEQANLADLVSDLAQYFGHPQVLPDWALTGAIVGLKDGLRSFDRLETIVASGAVITGLWCEDWAGLRETSFGRRLFWDWQKDDQRYPGLIEKIALLAERGIRFLAYINPYLCDDGDLFKAAKEKGYLARRLDSDDVYLADFGEFDCALVDFTNVAACQWFAAEVIGKEMLDIGISGWMADFGEYLPVDIRLHDGSDPALLHNAWPVLWAKVNHDAIQSHGDGDKDLFFMRSGGTGSQRYCPLLWAGDQSVDFSRHDGIGTVICGALSSGLIGNCFHHSDIGGYTSLHGNLRTAELMMRWAEMAAFTPVMRTHEGNRPDDNLQIDSTEQILNHFAAMTCIHKMLLPYSRSVSQEAALTGIPAQRPMFLHFEDQPQCNDIQDQYLFGPDLVVAPIVEQGQNRRPVFLPDGEEWVALWTGEVQRCGWIKYPAPLGYPPVFYRRSSQFAPLFRNIGNSHSGRGDY